MSSVRGHDRRLRRAERMGLQQLQLLLLLPVAIITHQSCVAAASSVNVSTSQQLLLALQSSGADTIVLQNDVALGAEFDRFETQPLPITRQVHAQLDDQALYGAVCYLLDAAFACSLHSMPYCLQCLE